MGKIKRNTFFLFFRNNSHSVDITIMMASEAKKSRRKIKVIMKSISLLLNGLSLLMTLNINFSVTCNVNRLCAFGAIYDIEIHISDAYRDAEKKLAK